MYEPETSSLAKRPSAAAATLAVLFFGRVADGFGRVREVRIPAAGCSLATLKVQLGQEVEGGAEALGERGVRFAIDREMGAGEDAWVRPGQEVAFFSMFSGG